MKGDEELKKANKKRFPNTPIGKAFFIFIFVNRSSLLY